MNRLFVIAGLAILIVALVFLNQGIKKAGLPDNDDAPPPAAAKAAPTPPVKVPSMTPSAGSATLPEEQTVGDPATAKHHILVGWSYTDANQSKPGALATPLQAIQAYVQKNGGSVSAEIVNTDVPAADRSPAAQGVAGNGVFVDGKPVFTGDVSKAPTQQVVGAIQAATK